MAQRRESSFNERQLVIFHYQKGTVHRKIAEMLNMKRSTVGDIIRRYKNENRIDSNPRPGPKKIFEPREVHIIVQKIENNPKLSAPKLTREVNQMFNKDASTETVRKILRENGLHGRVARKKPFVNLVNRRRRMLFAIKNRFQNEDYWNKFIFADESKYNISGSDGRVMVWRRVNTALNPEHIRGTIKSGGGSVMVWGCMSSFGVGNLVFIDTIMDKHVYLNLLQQNLLKSAKDMGVPSAFFFYQDNDPKHKSKIVQDWLKENCPCLVDTPAQSPDINPIENLWSFLERKIRNHRISNKEDLKKALQEEWKKIPVEYCAKLVASIPRRLESVIQHRGYPTKY